MIATSADGAPSGLQFRLGGFPVSVRWSFFAVVAVIGIGPTIDAARLAIWVGVVFASVMIHELGHASAARRLGAAPEIELYGMGGLTRWGGIEPTRRQMIGVTLAGPGAGFLVGAVVGGLVLVLGTTGTGDVRFFTLTVLWVNIGWGVANLLPVLPLDGGHVFAELLPGDRPTRHRRAAALSIVAAVVGAVVLLAVGWPFGLIICGWAALTNWSVLRSHRTRREAEESVAHVTDLLHRIAHRQPDVTVDAVALAHRHAPENEAIRLAVIETAAAAGDAATARAMLDAPGRSLPPAAYALTFAVESDGRDGVGELVAIFEREPSEEHGRWLTIAMIRSGRSDELRQIASRVDADLGESLARTAELLGNPTEAAAIRASLSPEGPIDTRREPPTPSPPAPEPPGRR